MKARILLIALAVLAFVSCKEKELTPLEPETANYLGTVTVVYNDSSFDNDSIEVAFNPSEDGLSGSVTIYKIRFVPQMPVTIDVTVPNLAMAATPEKIVLSCEQVVPLAMGGEFPRYTVTDFRGEIVGKELSFSLNFGDYPTSFRGSRLIE
ncbi:MAG: hypothetical protein IJ154_01365 [Bacteroidales bacterium]|nr:hypothetical protein [Bacteroidales bacterium]